MRKSGKAEKGAVVLAGILLLLAVVWGGFYGGSTEEDLQMRIKGEIELFAVADIENSTESIDWGQPSPQGGPNWIFDLFTPPVIYYNEATGAFTVTPPFHDADPIEETFELEFVGVNRIPFRFQLVSYAGARGNFVLTIEDLDSGKDVFCAPAETISDFDFRVLRFSELREVATSKREGATEAFDLVGEAIVEDLRTGKQYTLHHDKITFLEKPVAQFVSPSGDNVYLAAGESWESSNATYKVLAVDHAAQTSSVEKTSPDVSDKVTKMFQSPERFNSSDLSNRKTRKSDPSPGTF